MRQFLSLLLVLFTWINIWAGSFFITSPDGLYKAKIVVDGQASCQVFYKDSLLFEARNIDILINRTTHKNLRVKTNIYVQDKGYNGLVLGLQDGMGLEFRLYNRGFAYRWIGKHKGDVKVNNETVALAFPQSAEIFFPHEKSFITHQERLYKHERIADLKDGDFAYLPILVRVAKVSVLVTEADLYDYPHMFVRVKDGLLTGVFPHVPLETRPAKLRSDRNLVIVKEAPYIALTDGDRPFPWRLFMLERQEKNLISNNLVWDLSRPGDNTMDFSWVKPGKVAWDWWNARQLEGVDFQPGINTETYKFYIDFAARFGLEYVIFDEGWSRTTWDLLHFRQGMDVKYLIDYARKKNVGIILWTLWGPLDQNMVQVLDSFAAWGVAGIKVDFMQRADQKMVNFYQRVAHEAAKRHLIVDFHGSFKPAGLRRAYPNVLSYEGVRGAENNKWSKSITPVHNLTLPFTRNVAGPMDYTPGGMLNTNKDQFVISWKHPRVMGTRANQIAMYVVYFSPLQMLSDSPTNYLKNLLSTKFIAQIPTVWDQTVPLAGRAGEMVAVARRNGQNWYVGVMNGETPRAFTVRFDFLPEGQMYQMQYIMDAPDSDVNPTHYKYAKQTVTKGDKMDIYLQWGGGFAAILTPVKD